MISLRQQALIASTVRLTAIATAILMVTILTVSRSQAAFTATTANGPNAFATGSVVLSDDDSGTAMFNVSNMTPGNPVSRCITVTYSGTVLPAPVRLHATSGGSLDAYLNTTIEIGTGGSFSTCTGFVPTSTLSTGTLAAFSAARTDFASGLTLFTAAANPTTRTLRFTIDVADNNAAQALSTSATFTFETQS